VDWKQQKSPRIRKMVFSRSNMDIRLCFPYQFDSDLTERNVGYDTRTSEKNGNGKFDASAPAYE